jgi:hypothetical protein
LHPLSGATYSIADELSQIMKSTVLLILLIIVANFDGQAQAPGTYKAAKNDSTERKSELNASLRYTSDYYFMGMADSTAAPYLSPTISYIHKSGISLRSSLSYLTAKDQQRIDLITLSGGYDYYHKNFALGASLSQYFYSDLSYVVASEMTTYLNAYAGYDFQLFTLFSNASIGVSSSADLFLGFEIDRTFYAIRNHLRITPSLSMNAGSQQYYNEYYLYRSSQGGNGPGKGPGHSGTTSNQVIESTSFKILDYEAGIQVVYKINKIRFFVSSVWLMPVNPATLITDTGIMEEELKNGFYWSSGLRYTF